MSAVRSHSNLAWIVVVIAACAAAGFAMGVRRSLAGPAPLPGEVAGAAATPVIGTARDAAAPGPPLTEGRVHEIAREEADAALLRVRPPAPPHRARPAVQNETDADEDAAAPMPPPVATPPAAPQDQPSNPDVQ